MARINSKEELSEWLAHMPVECARIIAARNVLRVVPTALPSTWHSSAEQSALALFRASSILWAARNYPNFDMRPAASYAARALYTISRKSTAGSSIHAIDTALTALHAADAALPNAIEYMSRSASAASTALHSVGAPPTMLFQAIEADSNWIEAQADLVNAVSKLTGLALWLDAVPDWHTNLWNEVGITLLEGAPHFGPWVDWYERRIRGQESAFDVPGDIGRKEDKAILRRLANATEDFWDRGAEHVNTQLAAWLEEARERAAQRDPEDSEGEVDPPTPIPAQSRAALRFGSDEEGKIVLAPSFGNQELRNDDDARERHQLALDDAKALMQACAGSNSADRLTAMLTAYVAAAGDSIETMRPSVFVQKGERLRQESARYEDPDNFLPPLPDGIELDLKSLVKAHNMVVGLDPHLLDIDTAQTGPDDVIGDVTKPEMQGFAKEAREEEILREDAADDLVEAVDLTPDGADASDRRFRWGASSCKNLVIEAFAVALNHPVKTTAVVAGSYAIGPVPLVGNALACAIFLVSRRKWIEEKLGRHAPTWKALFSDLCDKWDDMLDKPDG